MQELNLTEGLAYDMINDQYVWRMRTQTAAKPLLGTEHVKPDKKKWLIMIQLLYSMVVAQSTKHKK